MVNRRHTPEQDCLQYMAYGRQCHATTSMAAPIITNRYTIFYAQQITSDSKVLCCSHAKIPYSMSISRKIISVMIKMSIV